MTSTNCATCGKSKAKLNCGICNDIICKSCTQFVDENTFSFFRYLQPDLRHTAYCVTCYDQKVAPTLANYTDLMDKAHDTIVFMKAQNKETHRIKRDEEVVKVVDCSDKDETILRLAFYAAQKGFNAIIDVEVTPKKVKNGNYQTTVYTGTAIPAQVDESKIIKDRSTRTNPN
ncbi:hypothetical protein K2P97_07730 [bacterium]|nr:hypothetical protein [bacterium]